ncbi:MAG: replicative DNA helicase [Clostridia bacterium]|nr:replicative DNA helicase [Clostridia bacterium]
MAEDKKRKNQEDKVTLPKNMPNSLEAEQSVLCSAMIDSDASLNIVARLKEDDFYSESHKIIFNAMQELYKANKPIDFVTLADYLQSHDQIASVGGISYLTSLTNTLPSAAHYATYVDIVKKNSTLREVIVASNKIINKAYSGENEDTLGFAEKAIFEISEKGQVSALEKLADSLSDVMETFDDINKGGGKVRGVPTGFYQLDRMTNGLQKSDLIILAARPSVGKTSFAMNVVSNAALEGNARCAVFSLEMSKEQLAQRMLCSVANVDMTKALHGELEDQDWTKLWKAHKKLSNCKIYVDDNALNTPSQIMSKCRKLKRERGLDLIMIDYLQLMESDVKSDSQQDKIREISRRMKILAKEINVPVILLSQLSRAVEKRPNSVPGLSDLRDSGAIEQDADIVIFLHRPDDQNPATALAKGQEAPKNYQVQLIVAKHRNGELGTIPLAWIGSRVSFADLEKNANQKSMEQNLEGLMPPPPQDEMTEVDFAGADDIFSE